MAEQKTEKKQTKCRKVLKTLAWIFGSIFALIILSLIIFVIWFNSIVQTTASQAGSIIIGAPVSVQSAKLNIFTAYLKLEGIAIGNPKGYKSKNALTVKKIIVDLDPFSFFSKKIRIEEFTLDGVDVYYEQGMSSNNLNDLNKNAQEFQKKLNFLSDGKTSEKPAKPEKPVEPIRLQIDKLRLVNIYVNTVITIPGAKTSNAPMPILPISLDGLGAGEEGLTGADLINVIFNKLTLGAFSAMGDAFGKGVSATGESISSAAKGIGKAAGNVTDSVKKLFK